MQLHWMDLGRLQCQVYPGAPCPVLGQLGMAPPHLQVDRQTAHILLLWIL